ncbi:DUF4328 domain-containing protein [Pseudonocardiaceae bacterium YIM PH 21723]|nr:DUF4328 domain-containing protein [Pseudonocardiaceae bacterium YIM PH 21723]
MESAPFADSMESAPLLSRLLSMQPDPQWSVEWVASSPVPPAPVKNAAPGPYTGPPRYPAVPRWGFPFYKPLSLAAMPEPATPLQRMWAMTGLVIPNMWLLAACSLALAAAEVWRYLLVITGDDRAFSAALVNTSDALVISAGVVSLLLSLVGTCFGALWLLRARDQAEDRYGVRNPRSNRQALLGLLIPGLNLVRPGQLLTELEHIAIEAPTDKRPRPSRLVLSWWIAWAIGLLLPAVTLAWNYFDSPQAMADGILLHILTDIAAAVVAVLTVQVVRRLTALLMPSDGSILAGVRVIAVNDAPAPPLRPAGKSPNGR